MGFEDLRANFIFLNKYKKAEFKKQSQHQNVEVFVYNGFFEKMLSKTYGQSESSYIPLDYYFNSYCEDSQWNKQKLFFGKLSKKGEFKYL